MMFAAKRRVLLVEDDPFVAMVMEETLQSMKLEVLVDLNLGDALREVDASDFDVALVDVDLRGENGCPLILALLEKQVPFAVMSGGDLSVLAAEFPHIRMVSKPLEMAALQQLVRELLEESSSSAQG